jgi:hypothetical protein
MIIDGTTGEVLDNVLPELETYQEWLERTAFGWKRGLVYYMSKEKGMRPEDWVERSYRLYEQQVLRRQRQIRVLEAEQREPQTSGEPLWWQYPDQASE